MLQAWSDLRHQVENLGPSTMQVLKGLHPALVTERGKHRLHTMWKDITHRPYKIVRALIAGVLKGVGQDLFVENIPIFRDSSIVAYWTGTGFDTRLEAALRQLRAAYDCVKTQMPVRRIEVSIFAADRGAAIARQFANSLVKTYRCRNDQDLAIVEDGHATQIRIRFMGLFDSVASIMDENLLLDFTPGLGVIQENFSDRQLAEPTAVEQCVHFAAAHELRFYQRLNSLEKTRGEQYLYPGSSGDVTGVNPEGAQGLSGELSRIPLRDMLHRNLHRVRDTRLANLLPDREAGGNIFIVSDPRPWFSNCCLHSGFFGMAKIYGKEVRDGFHRLSIGRHLSCDLCGATYLADRPDRTTHGLFALVVQCDAFTICRHHPDMDRCIQSLAIGKNV